MPKRTTIREVQQAFSKGRKLSMVTAYDAFAARLLDAAEIDIALVGDSVGTTVQGRADTLHVTMEEMLYHTEIVARCNATSLIVGDMPFGSYQASIEDATRNAMAFLKHGANAVKLEGGEGAAPVIEHLCSIGVPVMGHLGYTPQSINATSGPRVNKEYQALLDDAKLLESLGVFSIVLEMVPAEAAKKLTAELSVPTIGIGAGPHCAGQVLVFHDMLGFSPDFTPKFLKRYFDFHAGAVSALREYKKEVEGGKFPGEEQSY